MTHILLEDPKLGDQLVGDFRKVIGEYFINQTGPLRVSAGVIDTWRDAWLPEFVGDMVAAVVTGPTFAQQWMRFSRELAMPAYEDGKTHPSGDARIRGVAAVLRAMGKTAEAKAIDDEWRAQLASTGQKPPRGYKLSVPDVLIDQLAKRVVDGCQALGIRSYDLATNQPGDIVGIIQTAWQQFRSDPAGYGLWERQTLRDLWSTISPPLASPNRVAAKGRDRNDVNEPVIAA
jgi:hypothetical protein